LRPEIPDIFIPLQYGFPSHDLKARLSGNLATAYDFFCQFWVEKVFVILVVNTNEYAAKMRKPAQPSRLFAIHKWKPVIISEMKKFIAQLIFMGWHECKAIVEYWRHVKWDGRTWRVKGMLSL